MDRPKPRPVTSRTILEVAIAFAWDLELRLFCCLVAAPKTPNLGLALAAANSAIVGKRPSFEVATADGRRRNQ